MNSWAIYTGCWLTARKTFCIVCDPSGEVQFRSRRFWPCVVFLDELEIREYIIVPDADEGSENASIRVNRERDQAWLD